MKKAIVFVPTGNNPDTFDDRYDKNAHWRSKHPERTYEIVGSIYKDGFIPDPSSYDYIYDIRGHKWQMIREVFKQFDYSKYDYVCCIDDDQITDVWNLNKGLELARRFDFRIWQLSMAEGSDLFYNILRQDKSCDFSETNFVEIGVPCFRVDVFEKILRVLDKWDFTIGYGLDKAFCDIAQTMANVVHCASIYHPPRHRYYDKTNAMKEHDQFLYNDYPRICRELFNRESLVIDRQYTTNKYKITE